MFIRSRVELSIRARVAVVGKALGDTSTKRIPPCRQRRRARDYLRRSCHDRRKLYT